MKNAQKEISKEEKIRRHAIHTLRINVKSLSSEAKINRAEAKKVRAYDRWVLNHHRTGVLRQEARYTHLALAFTRARPYKQVEAKVREYNEPGAHYLHKKIKKHWPETSKENVAAWLGGDD